MISLNLSKRDPMADVSDAILLVAHGFREFTTALQVCTIAFRETRMKRSRYVAGELRKLPHARRAQYWRERKAGAYVLEALAVAKGRQLHEKTE